MRAHKTPGTIVHRKDSRSDDRLGYTIPKLQATAVSWKETQCYPIFWVVESS